MKAADVIQQLALKVPEQTNLFTTNVAVQSLSASGTTATVVTTTPHGLQPGNSVRVVGAKTPIAISSLNRSGAIGTLVTSTPHDITTGRGEPGIVEISGANEPEFNGTFTVLTAPDRYTITFSMVDSGPTVATGSPQLDNGASELQSLNGLYAVASVIDDVAFTYTLSTAITATASGVIEARTLPRISGAVTNEQALAAYADEQRHWLFVVLHDVQASTSRVIDSDAVNNLQRGSDWRHQLVQGFSVLAFFPAAQTIAGRSPRDDAEDVMLYLCRSLLGVKFDSRLSCGVQGVVNFSGHNFFAYNSALYVHEYTFSSVVDLVFEDTIGYDTNVAFRDIQLDTLLDHGTKTDKYSASIDLDENAG